MDLLQEVALKYGYLLNKDYLIKASYKKETIEICFFLLTRTFLPFSWFSQAARYEGFNKT